MGWGQPGLERITQSLCLSQVSRHSCSFLCTVDSEGTFWSDFLLGAVQLNQLVHKIHTLLTTQAEKSGDSRLNPSLTMFWIVKQNSQCVRMMERTGGRCKGDRQWVLFQTPALTSCVTFDRELALSGC